MTSRLASTSSASRTSSSSSSSSSSSVAAALVLPAAVPPSSSSSPSMTSSSSTAMSSSSSSRRSSSSLSASRSSSSRSSGSSSSNSSSSFSSSAIPHPHIAGREHIGLAELLRGHRGGRRLGRRLSWEVEVGYVVDAPLALDLDQAQAEVEVDVQVLAARALRAFVEYDDGRGRVVVDSADELVFYRRSRLALGRGEQGRQAAEVLVVVGAELAG